ncbi:MAG: pentapeptide repeat-containing protein [Saprospiraceae bacterium]|nr:pentapeptide repeat-containing protein [Saprospiraceae bacterium]
MKSKHIITGVGMLLCLVFFNLPDAAGQSTLNSKRVRQEQEDADKGKCWVIRHPLFARDCWARKIKNGGGDKKFPFAKLSRMSLYRANLTEALLTEADLTEANLTEANLTEALLSVANLTKAVLNGTNLTKAVLNGTNLTKAELNGANLTEARLHSANLTKADLSNGMVWYPVGANLTGAELNDADLTGADLTGADLTNARLDGAILTGAIVSRSKTKGIDFEDWKSRGAIIRD